MLCGVIRSNVNRKSEPTYSRTTWPLEPTLTFACSIFGELTTERCRHGSDWGSLVPLQVGVKHRTEGALRMAL